jgi:hypothetical protein
MSPLLDDDPQNLADYLELRVLASSGGEYPLTELLGALDLLDDGIDAPNEDIDDDFSSEEIDNFDIRNDDIAITVAEEIDLRSEALGHEYPFSLSEDGDVLKLAGVLGLGQIAYIFCLALSHANGSTISEIGLMPNKGDDEARLFQACGTVAMAGMSCGPTFWFGWPRPDEKKFLKKLKIVIAHLNDGSVRDRPRVSASADVKDDEVDTISWSTSDDDMPVGALLMGQIASGTNWKSKSLKAHLDKFIETWLSHKPGREVRAAIIIPHCLFPPTRLITKDASRRDVMRDYFALLMMEFGEVVYRQRLAKYLKDGVDLAASGVLVEGLEEIEALNQWYQSFRYILNRAA